MFCILYGSCAAGVFEGAIGEGDVLSEEEAGDIVFGG